MLDWNAVRYAPTGRRDHVESYFLKANEPGGDRAIWLKATVFAKASEPERAIVEGWAIAFDRRGGRRHHVAAKHTLPWADARLGERGLDVRWRIEASGDEMLIVPGQTRGSVSSRDARVAWDLRFAPTPSSAGPSPDQPRPMVPLPMARMYEGGFPKSKLVTPWPDAMFDGTVTVGDERWDLEGWRGMQGHNWGRGHADLYAWCHGNVWRDESGREEDFVLEGLSARVKVGPVLTPLTTLVCVRHRGSSYDWNRPLDIVRASGDVGLRRWSFAVKSDLGIVEGYVEAETDDFVGLYYPSPNGVMTHCLNSKLASARVTFQPRGKPPLSLTTKAAALEIGTHDADHGVRMYA